MIFHLPAEVEGGWVLKVEYMTWRSSWGVEHWSRGTGLRPAIGTDLARKIDLDKLRVGTILFVIINSSNSFELN